jgi:hypothetical protein
VGRREPSLIAENFREERGGCLIPVVRWCLTVNDAPMVHHFLASTVSGEIGVRGDSEMHIEADHLSQNCRIG